MPHSQQTRPYEGRVCQVSCELLAGLSHEQPSAHDWRVQRLARRYALSPSTAGLIAEMVFGEVAND